MTLYGLFCQQGDFVAQHSHIQIRSALTRSVESDYQRIRRSALQHLRFIGRKADGLNFHTPAHGIQLFLREAFSHRKQIAVLTDAAPDTVLTHRDPLFRAVQNQAPFHRHFIGPDSILMARFRVGFKQGTGRYMLIGGERQQDPV